MLGDFDLLDLLSERGTVAVQKESECVRKDIAIASKWKDRPLLEA